MVEKNTNINIIGMYCLILGYVYHSTIDFSLKINFYKTKIEIKRVLILDVR